MWELFGWTKASRCKKLIGYARCRLKHLRNRRDLIVRHARSDIAQLLRGGHQDAAFFRVEQLVKDQSILAAYDLLDRCCELILLNLSYILKRKDCPNDVKEAISGLTLAAARCADLPELRKLRELFRKRYGNDFVMAAEESFPRSSVNEQIREKLSTRPVSDDERFKLIEEIAAQYDIQLWQRELGDGSNQRHQTDDILKGLAYNPRCDQGIDILEKDIQVADSYISRVETWTSNDEEMCNLPQREHAKKSLLLQIEDSSTTSSTKSKEMLERTASTSTEGSTTDQSLHVSSFRFKQESRPSSRPAHVHPKLPDYDDLSAKFTALRKEYLQQNATAKVAKLPDLRDLVATFAALRKEYSQQNAIAKVAKLPDYDDLVAKFAALGKEHLQQKAMERARSKKLIGYARCRLKHLRNRRNLIVRHARSDIAQLLRGGIQDAAFFRVEQLVKDQSIPAAYDQLDRCCELILLNLSYILKRKDCPNDVKEAISGLTLAAARCADLPELRKLRELFRKRYGNDFVMAAEESFPRSPVNEQIREKLSTRPVSDDERFKLIEEIAAQFNIQLWQRELGDGSNQRHQTDHILKGMAYNPRCEQDIDILEKDIQVADSYISRVETWTSNDEEMCNLPQREHAKKSLLLQIEDSSTTSSTKSEEMLERTASTSTEGSTTDRSLHVSSFRFKQESRPSSRPAHVHPKLPDYDDLSAKFTALRKEYLQQNATAKVAKLPDLRDLVATFAALRKEYSQQNAIEKVAKLPDYDDLVAKFAALTKEHLQQKAMERAGYA